MRLRLPHVYGEEFAGCVNRLGRSMTGPIAGAGCLGASFESLCGNTRQVVRLFLSRTWLVQVLVGVSQPIMEERP